MERFGKMSSSRNGNWKVAQRKGNFYVCIVSAFFISVEEDFLRKFQCFSFQFQGGCDFNYKLISRIYAIVHVIYYNKNIFYRVNGTKHKFPQIKCYRVPADKKTRLNKMLRSETTLDKNHINYCRFS